MSEQWTILGGTEESLDEPMSCSKLQSLLSTVVSRLNEQDDAIRQLRERDAALGKFRRQVVAALQMCAECGNVKAEVEERLLALEHVTTRLPYAEAGLTEAEACVQGLERELYRVELEANRRVASLKENMQAHVEDSIASLERKLETQAALLAKELDAHAQRSAASAEKLVTEALQRVAARLEGAERGQCACVGTGPLHELEGEEEECSACVGTGLLQEVGTGLLQEEEEEGEDQDEEIIMAAPQASVTPVEPTIPVGLLIPGQGAQYMTMMTSVQHLPAVKIMFEKAKAILGWDVLDLCLMGPESRLDDTEFCQPVMFIAGLAAIEKLRQDRKEAAERFQAIAGAAVGEYTALCAAGVFSFEDGLKLVGILGKAMQEAANSRKQAMLSVAGLDKPKLEELCEQAREKEGSSAVCQISKELFPLGFCCAGTEKAIHFLQHMCEKACALQANIMKGYGAFHTPLMLLAKEKVSKALDEMLPKMNPPRRTVYMTATAEPIKPGTNPQEVVELLKRQLTSPIMWESSMRAMIQSGVTEFYEVGPMKQLKGLMRRIDPKVSGAMKSVEV